MVEQSTLQGRDRQLSREHGLPQQGIVDRAPPLTGSKGQGLCVRFRYHRDLSLHGLASNRGEIVHR